MTIPKTKLHLKVVFDTNVIFNNSSSDLLTKEISELIEKHSNPSDLKISWHLPEIVLNERRFQMRKRGFELFPYLEKLERLLGHHLGISEEIIETRIDEAIAKSVSKYKLEIGKIVIEKVKWEEIIKCASYRLPPFEDNKTEKGFRDSLILEAFMQLVTESPVSISSCRIILITNDKLLTEATNSKILGRKNVLVLDSIEKLESLINILDSKIKEELINSISTQASELFFIPSNTETLYYKENIYKKINEQFENEITKFPNNADKRENIKWLISSPGFEKKVGQKIFWKTVISIEAKAFITKNIYTAYPNQVISGLVNNNRTILGLGSLAANNFQVSPSLISTSSRNQISEPFQTSQEVVSIGKSKFEVIWSVTLTTKATLKSPKIESIIFVETIWE